MSDKKRMPSPTDDEYERIAESIDSLDEADEIQDVDKFREYYLDYFEGNDEWQYDEIKQERVYKHFTELNENLPRWQSDSVRELDEIGREIARRRMSYETKEKLRRRLQRMQDEL